MLGSMSKMFFPYCMRSRMFSLMRISLPREEYNVRFSE